MNYSGPLLTARDLAVCVGQLTICDRLTLDFDPGQCWAVLGGNGVGKTTLLHAVAGLQTIARGSIRIGGQDLTAYRRRDLARLIGVLFQDQADLFPASVRETVLTGRHPHLSRWNWESVEDYAIADSALSRVGIESLARREVQTLSGGERRRLGIATLLAQAPQIMLLDEPTNHLDLKHQIMVLNLFRELAREQQKLVVMSLHDVNLAARFCDHALLLFGGGEVIAGPIEQTLTVDSLSRLYAYPLRQINEAGRVHFVPE